MKKIIFSLFFILFVSISLTQAAPYPAYTSGANSEYYLDRKIYEHTHDEGSSSVGVITRFGYAFNYDAFTYGASLIYRLDGFWGVTAGFDGYYIPNKMLKRTIQNDTVPSNSFAMPLWDVRAGLMFGKYFMAGALMGKSNINDCLNIVNLRDNAWFVNNQNSDIMYGGFITFVLPVSKYVGFNLDFAVTNKTGFNVGGGINLTIPVK